MVVPFVFKFVNMVYRFTPYEYIQIYSENYMALLMVVSPYKTYLWGDTMVYSWLLHIWIQ